MKTVRTRGIVLRKTHFSETSVIVTLYSELKGKLQCVAKGAQRKKSQFRGILDLFNHIEITYYENPKRKQELHTLIGCQLVNPYLMIRNNYVAFTVASYAVDLVGNLVSLEDPDKKIYHLLDFTLQSLENNDNIHILIRQFEIKLLALAGLLSDHFSCSGCSRQLNTSSYFNEYSGKIYCNSCKTGSVTFIDKGTLMAFSYLFRNSAAKPLTLKLTSQQYNRLDILLRAFVEHSSERRLKSRKFLDEILKNRV